MKKILTAGLNPAWQKTLTFDRLLPHDVNRAKSLQTIASGKGINFARAVRAWGAASATVLQPAGGVTGRLLTESLSREGLPCVTVNIQGETRTCSTLICLASHTATEIIEPGGILQPEEYENLLSAAGIELNSSDALAICGTLSPGIPEEMYTTLVSAAGNAGKPVLMDAYKGIVPALSAGVTILKINRAELQALTKISLPDRAIRECLNKYPVEIVAVTSGKEASMIGTKEGIFQISSPHLRNVVSPIGAGDTCSGVFFSEYLSGTDAVEAFARGMSAASASCMTDTPALFDCAQAQLLRKDMKITQVC